VASDASLASDSDLFLLSPDPDASGVASPFLTASEELGTVLSGSSFFSGEDFSAAGAASEDFSASVSFSSLSFLSSA
jgi:hypothetical protein